MSRRARIGPFTGALALFTLIGVLLRIPSFTDSLYADEMSAYFVVTEHGLGRLVDIVQSDQEVTPPLFFLLAKLTQGLGDPLDSLRWTPMVAGTACIPLTYLLGVRTLDRKAGVVGAGVMALSPFLIAYSTEARPYALLMLLCLASTLALVHALDGAGRGWWAVYALASCAAMYTHYVGVFVLSAQAVWALVFFRDRWRWIVGASAVAAIGWAPWLSSYRADQDSPGSAVIGGLHPFGLGTLRADILHWSIGHPITILSVRDMPGDPAIVLMGLGLAVGLAAMAVAVARENVRIGLPGERLTLVLVLALCSPLLAAVYSAVSVSVFLPRNLIASSPGLALALAWVVTRPERTLIWIPASALLLAGFAIGGLRMTSADAQRPDYKGVAAFIAERGGPAAVIVDSPGATPGPLSQLDAARAPGEVAPRAPAILRLSRPSRAAQLRASRPGGPGQFALLPIPKPRAVARHALRLSPDGTIFLVSPGSVAFDALRRDVGSAPGSVEQFQAAVARRSDVGAFARALPRSYESAETRVIPGFFGFGTLSVYVLRPDRA